MSAIAPHVALQDPAAVAACVKRVVDEQPVVDMHTHLYPPTFGTPVGHRSGTGAGRTDPAGLMLWGIDELLTYHYLIAEVFRVVPPRQLPYEKFWRMSKRQQADHVWRHLFVERSPVSESCRGVLTTLKALGLDTSRRDLAEFRAFFAEQNPDAYIDTVMRLANVESITMTNAVFDDNERQRWLDDPSIGDDPRFKAVLRFDPLLCDWPAAARTLAQWGYHVAETVTDRGMVEVRRFLTDWLDRTKSIYAAVSLPPSFRYPADDAGVVVLRRAVLPALAERAMPFAMMIGSQRGVNPALRDAGDMGFMADVASVARLCADHPDNRFLITMLSRENQHELAVAARKFGNLMVFGCWWFLNNPSIIEQITRLRVELLGTTFIPQHSDARVLDQLIYKWSHSRRIIADVLSDKYADLIATGWSLTEDEVRRDVDLLLRGNFRQFIAPTA